MNGRSDLQCNAHHRETSLIIIQRGGGTQGRVLHSYVFKMNKKWKLLIHFYITETHRRHNSLLQ